jgi:hypothetical protein
MPPLSLPALQSGKPTAWEEAIYAFLVEKRRRVIESGFLTPTAWPTRARRSAFSFATETPSSAIPSMMSSYQKGFG